MQNPIELRLYAKEDEKICYTFQPIQVSSNPDWNPQWEEWHSYPEPLRIFLTDFEILLRNYIDLMYPTADAFDKTPESHFDPCFGNWLSADDYQKLIDGIIKDMASMPEERILFYEKFLDWLRTALNYTSMIVIESNR